MIVVTLTEFNLTKVLETVVDLRAQGYKQGVDFDFAYTPEKYGDDQFAGKIQERKVDFTFYNEHLGLLFQLGR